MSHACNRRGREDRGPIFERALRHFDNCALISGAMYRDRMRAALVLGVMLLASCGSSGGVELVITPPANVDRIALYVGIGTEKQQGLAPSGFTQPISTTTWIRDSHNELS